MCVCIRFQTCIVLPCLTFHSLHLMDPHTSSPLFLYLYTLSRQVPVVRVCFVYPFLHCMFHKRSQWISSSNHSNQQLETVQFNWSSLLFTQLFAGSPDSQEPPGLGCSTGPTGSTRSLGRTIIVPPRTFCRTPESETAKRLQRPTTLPLRTLPAISITTPDTRSDIFNLSQRIHSAELTHAIGVCSSFPHGALIPSAFVHLSCYCFPAVKVFWCFQPEWFFKSQFAACVGLESRWLYVSALT